MFSRIFKYNNNHGKDGRFASADDTATADETTNLHNDVTFERYHGTTSDALNSIREKGLSLEFAGTSGDKYLKANAAVAPNASRDLARKPAVFVSDSPRIAAYMTPFATAVHPNAEAVVLKIEVPQGWYEAQKAKRVVEHDNAMGPFTPAEMIHASIPPGWIKEYAVVKGGYIDPTDRMATGGDIPPTNTWEWKPMEKATKADNPETVYAVIVTTGPVKKGLASVFKYNQNHDKEGRFATADDGVSSEGLGAVLHKMGQHEDQHPNIMGMVVDGKKPFGGDTNLGILRKDMPQIPGHLQKEFLKGLGVKVSEKDVDPFTIKPTQDQLDGFKVGAYVDKVRNDPKAGDKRTLISSDGYILDGHHHWAVRIAMSLESQKTSMLPVYKIHMPIRELLAKAHAFDKAHSIAGRSISAKMDFASVFKFNSHHDEKGRFAEADDSAASAARDTVYQANYGSPNVPVAMTKEVGALAESMHITGMKGAAALVDAYDKQHHDELVKMVDALPKGTDPFILLHRGDDKKGIPSIWLLGWSNKEATDIHDHINSEVGVKVLRGAVHESFYDYNSKDDIKSKEGLAFTAHERDLKTGSVSALPAPYIHKMVGLAVGKEKRDVTLHAYYPPLSRQNFFKMDEKAQRLKYDGYWDENDPKTDRALVEKGGHPRCFCCAVTKRTKIERDILNIFKEGTTDGAIKAWETRRNGGVADIEANGSPLTKGEFVAVKRVEGNTWARTDGKPLTDEQHARLKSLVIPPAYKSVKFNVDPMGRVQATGVNAVGKVQAKYHELHVQEAAQAKWDRVNDFHKNAIRGLQTQSAKDMNNPKLPESLRDTAATTNLIVHTGFRPGSETDTHAQEQAYGASTLEKRHISVDGSKISFDFTGKKGVEITKSINNPALAQYLAAKLPGKQATDKIFTTSDSAVRGYVKKVTGDDHFKTKDIRTWNGTGVAYKMTRSMDAPTSLKELNAAKIKIGDAVAAHLGNTRTVALKSYVAPYVFRQWERKLGIPVGSTLMKPKRKEEEGLGFDDVCAAMDHLCSQPFQRSPIDWRTLPDDEDMPYMVYK